MSYTMKCKVWKDDMSAPHLYPYIWLDPMGPGGPYAVEHDGGSPYRWYTFTFDCPIDFAHFRWWQNLEILPENGWWFWIMITNIAGQKTTITTFYTNSDLIPFITWNFEFQHARLAWYDIKACDPHYNKTDYSVPYPHSSPFMTSVQKVEGGQDRVYFGLKALGKMGYTSVIPSLVLSKIFPGLQLPQVS